MKIVKPSPQSPHRVDGMISLVMACALANDAEVAVAAPSPEIVLI